MMRESLIEMLPEIEAVARRAGERVMEGYRHHPSARKKGAIDLVTEYDLASEALITEQLSRTWPNIAIVAEEAQSGADVAVSEALRFFVDPIDGTTNFAHGHPFFAVSIGLCQGAAPVLGVVFAPALQVCWSGAVGQGAWRNGAPCRVSSGAVLRDALCATGFGYEVVGAGDDNVAEFAGMQERSRGVRRCGAAAIDLALVADGTYDAYWEYLLQPWDIAAGAALVLAAGGTIGAFDGGPPDIRSGAVVASNGPLHQATLSAIAQIRAGRPVPVR